MRYLLDTCVLSEMIKSVPEANVIQWFQLRKPHELFISTMTWGELKRGSIEPKFSISPDV